jgi:hypothetical protein
MKKVIAITKKLTVHFLVIYIVILAFEFKTIIFPSHNWKPAKFGDIISDIEGSLLIELSLFLFTITFLIFWDSIKKIFSK